MMSLSSSQAGIVGARRNKLNQTQFSSYRRVKVEHNRPVTFSDGIPKAKNSFIARHIYNYNKTNNTFTFLGTQKGQSLIRKKEWVNQLVFTGSNPAILDGTYIRSDVNSTVFWKNGIPNSDSNIALEDPNIWYIYTSVVQGGIAAVLTSLENQWTITELYVDTLNNPAKNYTISATIDNTTLKNINNNKLYNTKGPDLALPEQIFPDVNFNINTSNVFDTKNLAHNEKVFVDVRWTKITVNTGISPEDFDNYVAAVMNDRKGFIYRVGVLIKDNTIDSMLYHTDLATDEVLIRQLQQKHSYGPLLA